jgi:DNA-binding MarR family transcriptional regulator
MTKLVGEMERAGLVERLRNNEDRRVLTVRATAAGKELLLEGRRRRVARLAAAVAALPLGDRKLLARAAELLERVARPAGGGER